MSNPPRSDDSPGGYVKGLRILFWALIFGFVFMLIVAIVFQVVREPLVPRSSFNKVLLAVTFLLGILGGVAGTAGYKKGIILAKNLTGSLNEKLNHYRSVLIRSLALFEGPGMFSLIVYILTGEWVALLIAGIMLVLMINIRPTVNRLVNELNLGWTEQQQLESSIK